MQELAGEIASSRAVFAVDYRGITVAQAAELRARLREADARLRVVKNSLTERAAQSAGAPALIDVLQGPTALALVRGDAALAAKVLSTTSRSLGGILEFKGGMMDGAALSAAEVGAISRLPAREVLNAQLVGAIASPLTGLVRTLNALIAGVAIQLQAIVDRGLVGGAAEPAAAEAPSAETTPAEQPAPSEQETQAAPTDENDQSAAAGEPAGEA